MSKNLFLCDQKEGVYQFMQDLLEEYINKKQPLSIIFNNMGNINEDTSGSISGGVTSTSTAIGAGTTAYANASISGMGGVVSSQPSSNSGALNGSDWSNGGGTIGSGDVSFVLNGKNTNPAFKKRKKKIKNNKFSNVFSIKQDYTKGGNILSYDDFIKQNINKIKK